MASSKHSIGRNAFVQRFHTDAKLTYEQATAAHEVMIRVIEEAVSNGQRVVIGKVGALTPRRLPSRVVRMGFKRHREGITNESREYIVAERLKYSFNLFKCFIDTHVLNW